MLPVHMKLQHLWMDGGMGGSWAETSRPASGAADLHLLFGNATLQPNREGTRFIKKSLISDTISVASACVFKNLQVNGSCRVQLFAAICPRSQGLTGTSG